MQTDPLMERKCSKKNKDIDIKAFHAKLLF